jgi:hypothetical protein
MPPPWKTFSFWRHLFLGGLALALPAVAYLTFGPTLIRWWIETAFGSPAFLWGAMLLMIALAVLKLSLLWLLTKPIGRQLTQYVRWYRRHCTACNYNLAAHAPGSHCPECNAPVPPDLSCPPNPPPALLSRRGLIRVGLLVAAIVLPIALFDSTTGREFPTLAALAGTPVLGSVIVAQTHRRWTRHQCVHCGKPLPPTAPGPLPRCPACGTPCPPPFLSPAP